MIEGLQRKGYRLVELALLELHLSHTKMLRMEVVQICLLQVQADMLQKWVLLEYFQMMEVVEVVDMLLLRHQSGIMKVFQKRVL